MTSSDKPWDDLHHRSYFLPKLGRIEAREFILTMTGDRSYPINPLATHEVYAEGNMATIAETISINISRTLDIMENVFVGVDFSPGEIQIYIDLFKELRDIFSWSYEEMLDINPKIVEHEIATYLDAKPIQQNICLVNPRKEASIKVEVEKLLKSSFIYPIHLTQWVSNLMPVNKKKAQFVYVQTSVI
jgi:hypothetical protein